MFRIILLTSLSLTSAKVFAHTDVVEVYCLDQKTRHSYGVTGDYLKVLKGGFIEVVEDNGLTYKLDLTKGECIIKKSTIPDPYEG